MESASLDLACLWVVHVALNAQKLAFYIIRYSCGKFRWWNNYGGLDTCIKFDSCYWNTEWHVLYIKVLSTQILAVSFHYLHRTSSLSCLQTLI